MFEQKFKLGGEGYDLTLKKDNDYDKAKMRVLIVTQYINSEDLKARELLSCDDTKVCLENVIKFAVARARTYEQKTIVPKFCVVNFFNERHFHLTGESKSSKEQEFANRLIQCIKKINPTHILFCGNESYSGVTGNDYSLNRIGWVEDLKINKGSYKVTQTFDLFWCLGEKEGVNEGQYSNHLLSIAIHLSYLLNGAHPFSLKHIKSKPEYIDSKHKFDSLMDLLASSKYVGIDTETRNLTNYSNEVYTIQFSSDKSEKGYVLALNHPQTPWSDKQVNYFKQKIRKFLVAEDGPTLVGMNGKFDLRVIRQALKLPIINRPIWEITAGEHLLNEDMVQWGLLQSNRAHYGGLRAILATYENDFYFKNEFTKEDRETTGEVKPDDPAFLRYAAMDVCCLIPLMRAQVRRASFEQLGDKSYKPYFIRHMLYEMSDTVHVLSHLDQDGSFIDMKHMNVLAGSNSPFVKILNDIKSTIYDFEEVKQANQELLKEAGFKSKGLFGTSTANWIFNLGKAPHRLKLFLEVMGLKSVDTTSKGEPSIGKKFIQQYAAGNQVVEAYAKYQEVNKVYTSYIKSWAYLLNNDSDSIHDYHLRPNYGFWGVATGRISSQNPSLQVIPQHSESAKPIKRAFIAPPGHMLVHYDYSAHEVRGWAIASGDDVLANAFREGQKLRQKWIANPSPEIKQAMKTKGDIHVQNVHRFFNKWVDKKDPLRQAVKAVVFGVLYGKSASSLGQDTKTGDIGELKSKINKVYHEWLSSNSKKDRKVLADLRLQLEELQEEDRTEYAQHIIDKMFTVFKDGAHWTKNMKTNAEKLGYVYSPLGRIRHLGSTLFVNPKNKRLINRQIRRGTNAPIQGFASELAVKAARLTIKTFYSECPKLFELLGIEKRVWDLKVESCRMVHDASYYAVPYELVIPFIHISQWCATYGVVQQIESQFGLKFNIEPEIEYEIATCDADEATWDWSIPNLLEVIRNSLVKAKERGEIEDVEEVYDLVVKPWVDKESRTYLCSKYPLLNVKGLDKVIAKALNE